MIKQLKALCNKHGVCIYTDQENTEEFYYGSILSVNEDEIAIYMISPDGEFDGVIAINTSRVFRVDVDSIYQNKMIKLCSETAYDMFDCELDNNNIFSSLLRKASSDNEIVSLELLDSGVDDIMGLVNGIYDNCVEICNIDSYGIMTGYSFVRKDDITQICIASDIERRTKRLMQIGN